MKFEVDVLPMRVDGSGPLCFLVKREDGAAVQITLTQPVFDLRYQTSNGEWGGFPSCAVWQFKNALNLILNGKQPTQSGIQTKEATDNLPWCPHCKSYHVSPVSLEHQAALKCEKAPPKENPFYAGK